AFAATTPDKPAMIRPATGEQITYAQLESRSAQLAHLLVDDWGLRRGDTIAVISDNTLEMVEIYWAALRSGLYISAVNHHLTPEESTYIVNDCGARALFVSAAVADHVDLSAGAHPAVEHRVAFGGALDGFEDLRSVMDGQPTEPPADQPRGHDFLYSSGTTGPPRVVCCAPQPARPTAPPPPCPPRSASSSCSHAASPPLSPPPRAPAPPLCSCGVATSAGGTLPLQDNRRSPPRMPGFVS